MKKLLLLALTLVLAFSLAFTLAACGNGDEEDEEYVTLEQMVKNCERLKANGEIATFSSDSKSLYAYTEDGDFLSAQGFQDTQDAIDTYNEALDTLKQMEDSGTDVSNYVVKRMIDIVIVSTSKALYNKIVC
jgi:uncharacterized lipoprotein YehR (DUF1307 family)